MKNYSNFIKESLKNVSWLPKFGKGLGKTGKAIQSYSKLFSDKEPEGSDYVKSYNSINDVEDIFKTSPLYKRMMEVEYEELKKVYRVVSNSNEYKSYNVVDPKKIERVSPNAMSNTYNLIFSNIESWSNYPKRNRSLICADIIGIKERDYGDDNLMVVIPLEDSSFGVCPTYDLWQSFKGLSSFSSFFNQLYWIIKEDMNWEKFLSRLEECDKDGSFKEIHNYMGLYLSDNKSKVFKEWKDGKIGTMEFICSMINPKENGFSILEYDGTNLNGRALGVEVWTESKSLLIRSSEFRYFYDYMKKSYNK